MRKKNPDGRTSTGALTVKTILVIVTVGMGRQFLMDPTRDNSYASHPQQRQKRR